MSTNARIGIRERLTSPSGLASLLYLSFDLNEGLIYINYYPSHLLNVSTDVSFPRFGEERGPSGEVLLKLWVGALVAAVAAAGGASPGHLEGGSFVRAARRVCHPDYRYNILAENEKTLDD